MDFSSVNKDSIKAVFSDLDDTMTEGGKLPSSVVSTLEQLKEKGYWLGVISGRPAGWADCLMRLLPLDVMVFENGAGFMIREGEKIRTESLLPNLDIVHQKARLRTVFDRIKKEFPQIKLATDQPYRLFDYALDFNEEPPKLSSEDVDRMMELLAGETGITAKLSSIHINYWCGSHTKVTAVEEVLRTEGKKRGISKSQIVFFGDSPNDEPLFEYFDHSVGVANIKAFLPRLKHRPKYLAKKEGASGFVESLQHLLAR